MIYNNDGLYGAMKSMDPKINISNIKVVAFDGLMEWMKPYRIGKVDEIEYLGRMFYKDEKTDRGILRPENIGRMVVGCM